MNAMICQNVAVSQTPQPKNLLLHIIQAASHLLENKTTMNSSTSSAGWHPMPTLVLPCPSTGQLMHSMSTGFRPVRQWTKPEDVGQVTGCPLLNKTRGQVTGCPLSNKPQDVGQVQVTGCPLSNKTRGYRSGQEQVTGCPLPSCFWKTI